MINFFEKQKKEPRDLKELLDQFRQLKESFKKLSEESVRLKEEQKSFIQKIGIVRFNPFAEVGSDQSFSVALLDGDDSGVVVTSLYTREENRIYAKPIEKGQSQYILSDEEKEAIKKAQNSKTGNSKKNHSG